MSAPLPAPQYIDYTTNVLPYIGTDKILVSDSISTGVPTSLANQLIAEGEALALADIAPYYVTNPALITLTGGTWTTLQDTYPQTYNVLYYMFVVQASLKLIGNFIARNTDQQDTTLSYFQNFYDTEYAKYLNRILDKLSNGSYRYQLFEGLLPLSTGIPRVPVTYARSGSIGGSNNYPGRQMTNPQQNFSGLWPYWWGN
jgi:hypothetical protein